MCHRQEGHYGFRFGAVRSQSQWLVCASFWIIPESLALAADDGVAVVPRRKDHDIIVVVEDR